MGGLLIDQPLPSQGVDYIDPFLLVHHWQDTLPGNRRPQEVGVGPHPHRGFSPVTFVFKGSVRHQDSLGHDAVVGPGGTQWMFAGRGITHSERPDSQLAKEGGEFEIIQFWVNAPAVHKMDPPFYRPIAMEDTPAVIGKGSTVHVVSGEYEGTQGVVTPVSPLTLLRVGMEPGATVNVSVPEPHNTIVYLLEGKISVNGQTLSDKDLAWLDRDGDEVQIEASSDSRFILLSGEPIEEPVASYGPFVMNTETEILEALRDSQQGKMGVLVETFEDAPPFWP